MKKIIFCLAMLIVANSIYSQQSNPSATMTKKDYLQKSKNQKTAAWLFMGGGIGLTILGLSADNANENNAKSSGKGVAIAAGLSGISVGTTLFIAATRNKNKAQSLSFRMEKTQQVQQGSLVYHSYPALSFRINL
jgi:hypothetical protein